MSNEKALQDAHVKVGVKQTLRAIALGQAKEIYIAEDADPRITSKIIALCHEKSIKITYVDTMANLGKACGIQVGAAMVSIVTP